MDTASLLSKLGILKMIELLCSIIALSLLISYSYRAELQNAAVAMYAIVFVVSLSLLIAYFLRGLGHTKMLAIVSAAVHVVLGLIILIISAILLGEAADKSGTVSVPGFPGKRVTVGVSGKYIAGLVFGILTSLALFVDAFFIWKENK